MSFLGFELVVLKAFIFKVLDVSILRLHNILGIVTNRTTIYCGNFRESSGYGKGYMEYKELTEQIIGCAYRVYNKMGFGFLEKVYENCMLIELNKVGIHAESQKPITVYYENKAVGEFIADLIVNDTIILELKSVRRIIQAHEVQLVNYLVATGKPVGLILNFGETKVEIKRKVRELLSCQSCYPV